ncbi:DUF409 domain containing protein [Niveomyces insectorum RCEF 264]|uniref:GPI mannosyltransferase 2 n=1 Tax=Niveomyces insectorum RCEF 264 TaxID=1081102 RepID=A0A167VNB3_9HYPO|nr:DUF409 domain containing protein [Niveomyces insectorum RCEF 264]
MTLFFFFVDLGWLQASQPTPSHPFRQFPLAPHTKAEDTSRGCNDAATWFRGVLRRNELKLARSLKEEGARVSGEPHAQGTEAAASTTLLTINNTSFSAQTRYPMASASATTARSAATAAGRSTLLDPRRHPYRILVALFVFWKTLLLAIAFVAYRAGPAYDTSGSIVVDAGGGDPSLLPPSHAYANTNASTTGPGSITRSSGTFVARLISWDAVFFIQSTRRGYRYELEWAFSRGLPILVSLLRRALMSLGLVADPSEPLLAVCVAHAAHLCAVLLLYRLGRVVWLGAAGQRVALVAACLHVLSPAGLFLSAPYAEGSCALLTFAGYALYAAAKAPRSPLSADALFLGAGVLFGLATAYRSNGLLNGIVFAYEALAGTVAFVRTPRLPLLRRLVVVVLSGLAVTAGSVVPQAMAYGLFCMAPDAPPRPWCTRWVPSIYAFVQAHYWNTGLFNYWTLSNAPLFVIATPVLFVLTRSSLDMWSAVATQPPVPTATNDENNKSDRPSPAAETTPLAAAVNPPLAPMVLCMALSQVLMVLMALLNYHVQIITRLSSGFPLWYWWLAQGLAGKEPSRSRFAGGFVVFMVMYASIQGVLFASFLPPA